METIEDSMTPEERRILDLIRAKSDKTLKALGRVHLDSLPVAEFMLALNGSVNEAADSIPGGREALIRRGLIDKQIHS